MQNESPKPESSQVQLAGFLHSEVVCYAESFDFPLLMDVLLSSGRGARYRNVFYLDLEQGSVVIFPFGVVVYWNISVDGVERFARDIATFCRNPMPVPDSDRYSYATGCERTRFSSDHIELTDSDAYTLLAISHPLAQSTKLSFFESQAQRTIEETSTIPRKLARTGSSALSRKQIARMRGRLFLTKSDILLKYELLDTPDFFWEFPELEPIYQIGANYLELKPRTELLSMKLETIHELFEMLADELKHQHSSTLEWIIIWLIAVEIIIFIVNDVILA